MVIYIVKSMISIIILHFFIGAISEESVMQMLHPYKLKLPEQSLSFPLTFYWGKRSDNKARNAQGIMTQHF